MQLKLLREENGYSIYENPNPEMVEKIKNYPTPTKINHYKGILEYKETLENGNFLLKSENGDLHTMSSKDFEEFIEKTKLDNINKNFNINEMFNLFLPIHNGDEIVVKMSDDLLAGTPFDHKMSATSVRHSLLTRTLSFNNRYTNYNNGTKTHENEIKFDESVQTNCTYFNLNGEIVNRNYNYNFNEIEEPHDIEDEKDDFINYIVKQLKGVIEFKDNDFFCENYYFFIDADKNSFELNLIPNQGKSYYIQGDSYGKKTKPKNGLSVISKEDLSKFLEEQINNFLSKFNFK